MPRMLERCSGACVAASRFLRDVERPDELPDPAMVERVKRNIAIQQFVALDQCHGAVIENEPAPLIADRDHGMRFRQRSRLQNDKPHVVGCEAGIFKRAIFQHRKLLAVAPARRQRGKRRRPFAVQIARPGTVEGPYCEIGRPIDMADAGETFIACAFGDDRDELQRGHRPARLRLSAALRDDRLLGFDL